MNCGDRKVCKKKSCVAVRKVLIVFEGECCAATVVGSRKFKQANNISKLHVYRKLAAKPLT